MNSLGVREFHYGLSQRVGGARPGSHAGTALGTGHEFASHQRLFDRPDPRRLDLRASLQSVAGLAGGEWLVRVTRQRAGAVVQAVVDVSASMAFGATRRKLDVAADFVRALGYSAHRVGDALGLLAFDVGARTDLFHPPRRGRAVGDTLADALADALRDGADKRASASTHRGANTGPKDGAEVASLAPRFDAGGAGLAAALALLPRRPDLVFLVSDFHWPLPALAEALDRLAACTVVPVVVWDAAETEPPAADGLLRVHDAESGALRTLWMRPRQRQRWRDAVAARRAELDALFAAHARRAFYVQGAFDADALSRYFFEGVA